MAKQRNRLTKREILDWADAHYRRTGRWPTYRSGVVFDAPDEDWSAIDGCLEYGGFGLPGGSSLADLLARHRGLVSGGEPFRLSIKLILVWADRHYIRTGKYPTRTSGRIDGAPEKTWGSIDHALLVGSRGSGRRSSLAQLFSEYRGKVSGRRPAPRLSVDRILAWVDEHRARTGFWPTINAGAIKGQPGESWHKVDAALRHGHRGLRGGGSLPRLLAERRGKMLRSRRRRLSIDAILDWADRHRDRMGVWPTQNAGPVHDVPGESWKNIDDALRKGRGGLPGGSSLPTLLARHRGRRHMGQLPLLTVSKVLTWADQHRRRTGKWPCGDSGPVRGVPGESWRNIDAALERGGRGLPRSKSLARLLAKYRGKTLKDELPKLSMSRILSWADRHRTRTGHWPIQTSGRVVDAPENTWEAINSALAQGYRGLPGGSSLARLLAEKRGKRVHKLAPWLTVAQILRWADDHYRRTGDWPVPSSGPVRKAGGESWRSIDNALRHGYRGLDGGSSLIRLLDERRGNNRQKSRRPLSRKRTSARARRGPLRKMVRLPSSGADRVRRRRTGE